MPAVTNGQELKLAKMIYELRDSEDLSMEMLPNRKTLNRMTIY